LFDPTGHPTIDYLAKSGLLSIVETHWQVLGHLLGQSDVVESYEEQANLSKYDCCADVFEAWIDKGGSPIFSLTWKGLYDVLDLIY
jgi:hypothetical protein